MIDDLNLDLSLLNKAPLGDPLPTSPFPMFAMWLEEARRQEVRPNPEAMAIATVDASGMPTARMVLCRGFEPTSGFIVFYTNYRSRKSEALEATGRGAALFHWDTLQRQVRIEGPVIRSPSSESDAYFASRPRLAQISAWASEQSRVVSARSVLVRQLMEQSSKFEGQATVPRPAYWGGYRLYIERLELWISAAGRLHDRAVWTRSLEPAGQGFEGGLWNSTRLQP